MEHFIDSDSDDDSLRAPAAQRGMALAVALIAAVLIGGFAWLMIQALGG